MSRGWIGLRCELTLTPGRSLMSAWVRDWMMLSGFVM